MLSVPETRYARRADGLSIAWQAFGGSLDLVVAAAAGADEVLVSSTVVADRGSSSRTAARVLQR